MKYSICMMEKSVCLVLERVVLHTYLKDYSEILIVAIYIVHSMMHMGVFSQNIKEVVDNVMLYLKI